MFEAEPLVAHASDEPGAERTAEYLDAVGTDEIEGHLTDLDLLAPEEDEEDEEDDEE
jgi:hypothetical protein